MGVIVQMPLYVRLVKADRRLGELISIASELRDVLMDDIAYAREDHIVLIEQLAEHWHRTMQEAWKQWKRTIEP